MDDAWRGPHTPEIQSLHLLGGRETRYCTVPSNVSTPCPATHLPASTGTPNDRGAARGHSRSAIPGYLPHPDKVPSSAHAGPLPPWDRFSNVPAAIHLHAGPSSDFCCTTGMEGKPKEGTGQGRSRGEPTPNPDLPCPAEHHIHLQLSLFHSRLPHRPSPCRPRSRILHRRGRLGPSRIFHLSGFHPVRAETRHLTQVQVQVQVPVPCPRPRRHPPVQAHPQPTSSTETTHKTASAARTASVLPQPYHHHHHQPDHARRMPRLTNKPSTIQTPDLVPSVSRPASPKAPDGKPHIVAAPPPLRVASAAAVYILPTLSPTPIGALSSVASQKVHLTSPGTVFASCHVNWSDSSSCLVGASP